MVASAAAMGKTAWPSRCLAPQLVPSRTPPERTFKQASRHRHGRPQRQALHPSQVAGNALSPSVERRNRRVWKERVERAVASDATIHLDMEGKARGALSSLIGKGYQ